MIGINDLRTMRDMRVIILGSHPGIVQSMLDYEFLIGLPRPRILAIIATGRQYERFFWGRTKLSSQSSPILHR